MLIETIFFKMIIISRPVKKEPSMYQRLSAHLTSVEILSDLREISRISTPSATPTTTSADQLDQDRDHRNNDRWSQAVIWKFFWWDQKEKEFFAKKILDFYFCENTEWALRYLNTREREKN